MPGSIRISGSRRCPGVNNTVENITETQLVDDGGIFCSYSTDKLGLCWPSTPAGQLAVVPCPHLEGFITDPYAFEEVTKLVKDNTTRAVKLDAKANASRLCQANATWQVKTNYSLCKPITTVDVDMENEVDVSIIYYVGYVVSIIALLVAFFIFVHFRSLRCLRNTIHCHLIVAFILRNLLWLTMFPMLAKLTEYLDLLVCQILCKGIVALFNYLMLATFFWMLVEGLYIHTIVVCAFGATSLRLWYYTLIGWGGPFIFTASWVAVRASVEQSDEQGCWLQAKTIPAYDFIVITPILCILLVNMIFLGSVVFVLVTKLQDPNSAQTIQYRKAVRATLVLMPLLGLSYVILITNPGNSHISKQVFGYFNSILQSTQGLLVAVFYCFLNAEVRTVLSSRLASRLVSHQFSTVARHTHGQSKTNTSPDVVPTTCQEPSATLIGLQQLTKSAPV